MLHRSAAAELMIVACAPLSMNACGGKIIFNERKFMKKKLSYFDWMSVDFAVDVQHNHGSEGLWRVLDCRFHVG